MPNAYAYESNQETDDLLNNQGQGGGTIKPFEPAPFPFQKRQQALALRQELLKQQMRAQMGYTPRRGELIGAGPNSSAPQHWVGPSVGEHIAGLVGAGIQRANLKSEADQLGAEQEEFDAADRREAIRHAMARPTGTPEVPAQVMPEGVQGPPKPGTPAAGPTDQELLLHAQRGLHIPSRREALQKVIAELESPTRTDRKEDREDTRALAREKLAEELTLKREQLAQRAEEARQRSIDTNASIDQRREAAQQHNALMGQLAAARREEAAARASALKPLTQPAMKELTGLHNDAQTAERLSGSFKDEYAGNRAFIADQVAAKTGVGNDTSRWWSEYRSRFEDPERKELLGATLTASDQTLWNKSNISPGMDAKTVRERLAVRSAILKKYFLEGIERHDANQTNAYEVFGLEKPPKGAPRPSTLVKMPEGAPMSGKPRADNAPVQVRTVEEARKLKPGTKFIDPNGVPRTR